MKAPALRGALIALVLGWTTLAAAQNCDRVSTSCSLDSAIPNSNARTCALDTMNKHACMLNLLRTRVVSISASRTGCTSVTVPAGVRQKYDVVLQSSLTGTEIVLPSITESVDPPMLDVPGQIASVSGTTVAVPVFNRAETSRSGRLCVSVVIP